MPHSEKEKNAQPIAGVEKVDNTFALKMKSQVFDRVLAWLETKGKSFLIRALSLVLSQVFALVFSVVTGFTKAIYFSLMMLLFAVIRWVILIACFIWILKNMPNFFF